MEMKQLAEELVKTGFEIRRIHHTGFTNHGVFTEQWYVDFIWMSANDWFAHFCKENKLTCSTPEELLTALNGWKIAMQNKTWPNNPLNPK